jgi:carbamoyltransferase
MKDAVNTKIKHRESFRPFAPSTLIEAAGTYFDFGTRSAEPESPFMLLVALVRPNKRDLLPAITHVDGTARVQTVGTNRIRSSTTSSESSASLLACLLS